MRSQVREEFHRHVEEHYESLIVKLVKEGRTIVVFGRVKLYFKRNYIIVEKQIRQKGTRMRYEKSS